MSSVKNDLYILAGAAQDAAGCSLRPAALHWSNGVIRAIGSPDAVACPTGAQVVERPSHLVLPPLTNLHSHLDLTSIGPVPYGDDFIEWIDFVRSARPQGEALDESIRLGIEMSIAGGTGSIGDIAGMGSTRPAELLLEDGRLWGVSFIEMFGLGPRQSETIGRMLELRETFSHRDAAGSARLHCSFQPHAPYSAGADVYRAAQDLAWPCPIATHLAESLAEIEFTRSATGPFADYLRRIGKWDDSIVPTGLHPIEVVAQFLPGRAPLIAAHANYCEDAHIKLLAERGFAVAYCPRASAYFGHSGHRYREMLAAGVPVGLGTDSIINLDRSDRISILDEMGLLYRRDGVDPATLLRMATTNADRALGATADRSLLTAAGALPGLIAVEFDPGDPMDPLAQVLSDPGPIEWVARS